jgi:hypothetical protein
LEDDALELDDLIEEIRVLPRTKSFTCCGRTMDVSTLDMYAQCPTCGKRSKLRGYGAIGTEIQDVIDAVLRWMGTGQEFERILQRKKAMDQTPTP